MTNPHERPSDLDKITELLDGTGSGPAEDLNLQDKNAVAQQAFVTGFLQHTLAADEGHLDRQLGRAMAKVDHMVTQRRRVAGWLRWSMTAAAVMLVAWFTVGQRPDYLMAAVRKVVAAVQQQLDREFVVRFDELPETRLYLRGKTNLIAVTVALPRGEAALGCDGQEFWFVPPIDFAPVLVSRDEERMKRITERLGLFLDSFRLAALLERLTTDYDIRLTKDDAAESEEVDFTATRKVDADERAPHTIRVIANSDTGALRRMVATWGDDRPRMAPSSMSVQLVSERKRPDSFYGHESHHAPDRRVHEMR